MSPARLKFTVLQWPTNQWFRAPSHISLSLPTGSIRMKVSLDQKTRRSAYCFNNRIPHRPGPWSRIQNTRRRRQGYSQEEANRSVQISQGKSCAWNREKRGEIRWCWGLALFLKGRQSDNWNEVLFLFFNSLSVCSLTSYDTMERNSRSAEQYIRHYWPGPSANI